MTFSTELFDIIEQFFYEEWSKLKNMKAREAVSYLYDYFGKWYKESEFIIVSHHTDQIITRGEYIARIKISIWYLFIGGQPSFLYEDENKDILCLVRRMVPVMVADCMSWQNDNYQYFFDEPPISYRIKEFKQKWKRLKN